MGTEITVSQPPSLPDENRAKVTRLRDYQLDTIAQLSCFDANSPEQISSTTGVPVKTIINLLRGGQNKSFDALRAGYQQKVMRNFHGATMRMIDRMPMAEEAIERAIQSEDTKVAADNAWKLLDKVLPSTNQKTSPTSESSVAFIVNNPQIHNELNQTVTSVQDILGTLKNHLSGGGGGVNSHTLLGNEALPTPTSQLEVGDGEALPPLEDVTEGNLNLIEMKEEEI